MNKAFKKKLSFLLSVLLVLSVFSGVMAANAESVVAINETNFPDPVFRAVIDENYDTSVPKDHCLSEAERNSVSEMMLIWLADDDIESLKGIEYFTSLKKLYAGGLEIAEADFSALKKLESLRINGSRLTSLDVSQNPALTELNCRGSKELTSLKLNSGLLSLQCDECSLTSLDVSMCGNLTFLNCYSNEIAELNLRNNPLLKDLNCSANHLSSLDLAFNTELKVTEQEIGGQTVSASARLSNETIYAELFVSNYSRISSSSLPNPNAAEESENTYIGYDGSVNSFVFTDYAVTASGIDYKYYVNPAESIEMAVHVDIVKDFYQVNYLTAPNGTVISSSLVNGGGSVSAPAIPEAPDNTVCPHWSERAVNVKADMSIYPVWGDKHTYAINSFENHIAHIACAECGHSYNVSFIDCMNAYVGDENYDDVLNVNGDDIINGRDYAILIQTY